jgi:hypothetical protein
MSPDTMLMLARMLLVLAALAGFISTWITLQFTWNKAFEAPELGHGRTHPRYHAFRGAMLALAINILLLWLAYAAPVPRETLGVISFMLAFYYTGWWLPGPVFNLWAPNLVANVVHLVGTLGLVGVVLLYLI